MTVNSKRLRPMLVERRPESTRELRRLSLKVGYVRVFIIEGLRLDGNRLIYTEVTSLRCFARRVSQADHWRASRRNPASRNRSGAC